MAPDDLAPRATIPTPTWQDAYEAVLKALDDHQLFKLVEIAEAAAHTRLSSLEGSADHHAERQALQEALSKLQFVKRERLRFR